jgi:hypothetical protein
VPVQVVARPDDPQIAEVIPERLICWRLVQPAKDAVKLMLRLAQSDLKMSKPLPGVNSPAVVFTWGLSPSVSATGGVLTSCAAADVAVIDSAAIAPTTQTNDL